MQQQVDMYPVFLRAMYLRKIEKLNVNITTAGFGKRGILLDGSALLYSFGIVI